jgi:hypothetical protein
MKTKTKLRAGVITGGRTNNFNHNQKRIRGSRALVVKTRIRVGYAGGGRSGQNPLHRP